MNTLVSSANSGRHVRATSANDSQKFEVPNGLFRQARHALLSENGERTGRAA
jgi:hypothetical protein